MLQQPGKALADQGGGENSDECAFWLTSTCTSGGNTEKLPLNSKGDEMPPLKARRKSFPAKAKTPIGPPPLTRRKSIDSPSEGHGQKERDPANQNDEDIEVSTLTHTEDSCDAVKEGIPVDADDESNSSEVLATQRSEEGGSETGRTPGGNRSATPVSDTESRGSSHNSPARRTSRSANTTPVLIGGKPREFIIRTRAGARGSSPGVSPARPSRSWRSLEEGSTPPEPKRTTPNMRMGKTGMIIEGGSHVSRKRSYLQALDSKDASSTFSSSQSSEPSVRRRTIVKTQEGEDVEKDYYCWVCHKEGELICCELCPRSFHTKCVSVSARPSEDWACPECEKIMRAECMETQSKAMTQLTLDQLCLALRYVIQRMSYPGSEIFQQPVDVTQHPNYLDFIINPMDLSLLEKNRKQKNYGSTEAFLADAKWILHNCIIFNGGTANHKLTSIAKTIMKVCRYESSEIEVCPDCFMNSCLRRKENWFCEPCRTPHTLVWAKMKGYPYWPGKVLRLDKHQQVDVRFFGEHDRAWCPLNQVFMLSKKPPQPLKKNRMGFEQSVAESQQHIRRITEQFGPFHYAPNGTPYRPEHDPVCGGRPRKFKKKQSNDDPQYGPMNEQIRDPKVVPKSVDSDPGVTKDCIVSLKKLSPIKAASSKMADRQQSATAQAASRLISKYKNNMNTRGPSSSPMKPKMSVRTAAARARDQSNVAMETAGDPIDDSSEPVSTEDQTMEEADGSSTQALSADVTQAAASDVDDSSRAEAGKADVSPVKEPCTTADSTESSSIPAKPADRVQSEGTSSGHAGTKQVAHSKDVSMGAGMTAAGHVGTKQVAHSKDGSLGAGMTAAGVFTISPKTGDKSDYKINLSLPPLSTKTNVPKPKRSDKEILSKVESVLQERDAVQEVDPPKDSCSDEPPEKQPLEQNVDDKSAVEPSEVIPLKEIDSRVSDSKGSPSECQSIERPEEEITPSSTPKLITADPKKNPFLETLVESCRQKLIQETSEEEDDEDGEEGSQEAEGSDDSEESSSSESSAVDDGNEDLKTDQSKLKKKDSSSSVTSEEKVVKDASKKKDVPEKVISCGSGDKSDIQMSEQTSAKPASKSGGTHKPDDTLKTSSSSCPADVGKKSCAKSSLESSSTAAKVIVIGDQSDTGTSQGDQSKDGLSTSRTQATVATQENRAQSVHHVTDTDSDTDVERLVIDMDKSASPAQGQTKQRTSTEHADRSQESGKTCTVKSVKRSLPDHPDAVAKKARQKKSSVDETGQALVVRGDKLTNAKASSSEVISQSQPTGRDSPAGPGDNRSVSSSPAQPMADITRRPSTASSSGRPDSNLAESDAETSLHLDASSLDLTKYMKKASHALKDIFEEMCHDLLEKEASRFMKQQFEQELERSNWKHRMELLELKHNMEVTVTEMRLSWENEKQKMGMDFKSLLQREKKKAVREAKSKQWCAMCGDEAQFYCCWNTSYCNYPCQQAHWPEHMSSCAQTTNADKQTAKVEKKKPMATSASVSSSSPSVSMATSRPMAKSTVSSNPSTSAQLKSQTTVSPALPKTISVIPSVSPSSQVFVPASVTPRVIQPSQTSVVNNMARMPSNMVPSNRMPSNQMPKPINVQPLGTAAFHPGNEMVSSGNSGPLPGMVNPMMSSQHMFPQSHNPNMLFQLNMSQPLSSMTIRPHPNLVPMGSASNMMPMSNAAASMVAMGTTGQMMPMGGSQSRGMMPMATNQGNNVIYRPRQY